MIPFQLLDALQRKQANGRPLTADEERIWLDYVRGAKSFAERTRKQLRKPSPLTKLWDEGQG